MEAGAEHGCLESGGDGCFVSVLIASVNVTDKRTKSTDGINYPSRPPNGPWLRLCVCVCIDGRTVADKCLTLILTSCRFPFPVFHIWYKLKSPRYWDWQISRCRQTHIEIFTFRCCTLSKKKNSRITNEFVL